MRRCQAALGAILLPVLAPVAALAQPARPRPAPVVPVFPSFKSCSAATSMPMMRLRWSSPGQGWRRPRGVMRASHTSAWSVSQWFLFQNLRISRRRRVIQNGSQAISPQICPVGHISKQFMTGARPGEPPPMSPHLHLSPLVRQVMATLRLAAVKNCFSNLSNGSPRSAEPRKGTCPQ